MKLQLHVTLHFRIHYVMYRLTIVGCTGYPLHCELICDMLHSEPDMRPTCDDIITFINERCTDLQREGTVNTCPSSQRTWPQLVWSHNRDVIIGLSLLSVTWKIVSFPIQPVFKSFTNNHTRSRYLPRVLCIILLVLLGCLMIVMVTLSINLPSILFDR